MNGLTEKAATYMALPIEARSHAAACRSLVSFSIRLADLPRGVTGSISRSFPVLKCTQALSRSSFLLDAAMIASICSRLNSAAGMHCCLAVTSIVWEDWLLSICEGGGLEGRCAGRGWEDGGICEEGNSSVGGT